MVKLAPFVGVEEQVPASLIEVYPNPSLGIFNFRGMEDGHKNEVQIYTISGQLIHSSLTYSPSLSIDLSGFAKGMYFYRIGDGTKFVSGKLIVN